MHVAATGGQICRSLRLDQQTGTKRFSGMADGGEYAWGTGHKIPLDDVLALYLCIS